LKVLFVTPGNPFEDYGGLSIYTRQAIESLIESVRGIELTVLALVEGEESIGFKAKGCSDFPSARVIECHTKPPSTFTKICSVFLSRSFNSMRFYNAALPQELYECKADVLVLNHRLSISVAKRFKRKADKVIYLSHNDELNSVRSISDYAGSALMRFFVLREAEKIAHEEVDIMKLSSSVSFINKSDMGSYRQLVGDDIVTKSSVIPPYFSDPVAKIEERCDDLQILLVGSYDWLPKKKNAEWLANEVFPIVRRGFLGGVRLVIVGRGADFLNIEDTAMIDVYSDVPSVEGFYRRCDVFAIPESQKGGIKLKAIEASSFKLPIVTTRAGADGVGLLDNDSCLYAEDFDAEDFASKLIFMLGDAGRRAAYGRSAYDVFTSSFTCGPVKAQWHNFWKEIEIN